MSLGGAGVRCRALGEMAVPFRPGAQKHAVVHQIVLVPSLVRLRLRKSSLDRADCTVRRVSEVPSTDQTSGLRRLPRTAVVRRSRRQQLPCSPRNLIRLGIKLHDGPVDYIVPIPSTLVSANKAQLWYFIIRRLARGKRRRAALDVAADCPLTTRSVERVPSVAFGRPWHARGI